jgi:hypothetical protein
MASDKVVLAGYLVRCPLGGYAWQVLHYLAGLTAAGFDAYFYEDTAFYGDCFDPVTGAMHVTPEAGVAFAGAFFEQFGYGDKWVFWDAERDEFHGLTRGATASLLHETRVLITLAPVNRLPRCTPRQTKLFIDIDPAYTQLRAAQGDSALREILEEHDLHFTIGENIGTASCPVPTLGMEWRPTRQPVATHWWMPMTVDQQAPYTTIGRWDESARDLVFEGEAYSWSKRAEWQKFLELPARVPERFLLAMDIAKNPDDVRELERHGWRTTDPIAISRDAGRYRQFIQESKGEFTVAKDLNVRLRSGWFSDRGACYLAAGRPVVTQDTGFGRNLPTGGGLFGVQGLEDAVAAFESIAADYNAHAHAARQLAVEYFEAGTTVRRLLGGL